MAITKSSTETRTAYSNSVLDYSIRYNVTQENNKKAEVITGRITKGDLNVGNVYCRVNNSINADFGENIPDEDKKVLYPICVDDAAAIFTDLNKPQ